MKRWMWLCLFGVFGVPIAFAAQSKLEVVMIMPPTAVDPAGDRNVFSTSLDVQGGAVVTSYVAPPPPGVIDDGLNLQTIVKVGRPGPDGQWLWKSKVIEPNTARDPWHNQSSVAFDALGYVHVAYNMHNEPWQYSVSASPADVSTFEFRGQRETMAQRTRVHKSNQTDFPTAGEAAIPGNEITYPAFFRSSDGGLFVTYRYAVAPARPWLQRRFAGGIARYDSQKRIWQAIGGEVARLEGDLARTIEPPPPAWPFAINPGWTVYLPVLAFDRGGGLHVAWSWRPEQAGMETYLPSYAFRPTASFVTANFFAADGTKRSLPLTLLTSQEVGNFGREKPFYAPKSMAIAANGDPLLVLQPLTGGRLLLRLEKATGKWLEPEPTPEAASQIVVDRQGREWMFATGLKIFRRNNSELPWRQIGVVSSGLCSPFVKYSETSNSIYIKAKSCDESKIMIYEVKSLD